MGFVALRRNRFMYPVLRPLASRNRRVPYHLNKNVG